MANYDFTWSTRITRGAKPALAEFSEHATSLAPYKWGVRSCYKGIHIVKNSDRQIWPEPKFSRIAWRGQISIKSLRVFFNIKV